MFNPEPDRTDINGSEKVIHCPKCNATFLGPLAERYFLAHRQSHLRTIWVR